MRKWLVGLFLMVLASCGDDGPGYTGPTPAPVTQLNVSGEWPIVVEKPIVGASFKVAFSSARPECQKVQCSSFDGHVESDGTFVVPPFDAGCKSNPHGLFVAGWVETLPKCWEQCRADPYPFELECTADEQFVSLGVMSERCPAPPPMETVVLDITVELPTGLEDPSLWSLTFPCGDASVSESFEYGTLPSGDVSEFQIAAETSCSRDDSVQDDIVVAVVHPCTEFATATVSCTGTPQTVGRDSWQISAHNCGCIGSC